MTYVKKTEETKLIAEGGRLMGEILENLSEIVAPGISAFEINKEAEKLIRARGGAPAFKGYKTHRAGAPFPSTVCFSINDELVHGIATKEKIVKEGDLVSLDIGMEWPVSNKIKNPKSKFGGYFTDTAITFAVGKVSKETVKLMKVTHDALEVGIAQCKAGNTVADIGKAIEKYVKSQGKYGIVRDLVGHGVGHAVHEDPRVPNYYDQMGKNWKLEPGVVIAIEPMIAIGKPDVVVADDEWTIMMADGSLSAHFEHTVIITEGEPIVATRRPEEL